MQVGDPKKTAILAVAAVGALWFLGSRFVSLKNDDVPKATRQANAADATGGTMSATTVDQLRLDPFSHPKLAPHFPGGQQGVPTDPTPPINQGGQSADPLPTTDSGNGVTFDPGGPGLAIDKVPPDSWPKPQNPDKGGVKPSQTPEQEKLTPVTLKAIFKVGQRTAYLSVSGDEPRPFRMGDVVKDDLIVVAVNDDSVILKTKKRTLTLRVGQQGDL